MKKLLIIVVGLALLAPASGALAWITPLDITNGPDYECGPRIARDSSNNIHLVWYGAGPESSDWQIMYQKWNGSSWSAPVQISPSGAAGPDIAVDGQNNIHVVNHQGGNPEDTYYRKCTAGAWGSIVNLSNSGGVRSLTPRIAVDPTGSEIMVVWHESSTVGGNWDILSRRCSGGAWQAIENVSSDSSLSRTADVVRDSLGNYHVAWEDTDTRNVWYRMRSGAWGAKTALDNTSARSYGVALAVDPSNGVHAVWHDDVNNWDILYRCYNGSSWGPVENISNHPDIIDCEATVDCDSFGNVYVAWKDYDNIYYTHKRNGAWKPWYVVSPGTYQGGAHICLDGNGRCHLVWSSRMPGTWDVMWTWHDLDNTPPGQVSQFTASGSDSKVYLSWKNPSAIDFVGTMIRCKTTGYPTSPTDGELVCNRTGNNGWYDSFVHTGLANGVTYYYSAFSYDTEPNYAAAAQAQARTGTMSINRIKQLDDGAPVDIYSKVVTAIFTPINCFYVSESDRTCGIRVAGSGAGLAVGDKVNITGTMGTYLMSGVKSERQILTPGVTRVGAGAPLTPLAMCGRSVGGAGVGKVVGVVGGKGLNNIGTLAKITGRVTTKITDTIWVDDGSRVLDISDRVGVAVRCPDTSIPVSVGDYICAVGVIVGAVPNGWTENRRMVRIRSYSDLVKINTSAAPGTIKGTVTDSDGVGIAGATVSTSAGGYSTSAGPDGSYFLSGVASGAYNVTASRSGYQSQTQNGVAVRSGEATTVSFVLSPAPP